MTALFHVYLCIVRCFFPVWGWVLFFVTFRSLTFVGTCLGWDFFSPSKWHLGENQWLNQAQTCLGYLSVLGEWGLSLCRCHSSSVSECQISQHCFPTGQDFCLWRLIGTSMASWHCIDFFYLPLPERRHWGYWCCTVTFTALSRC